MVDLSQNTCYLKVVRPPTKSVKHCTSGLTQIERVSLLNNHQDLQYSIKHSKILTNYRQKYPYDKIFEHNQCKELLDAKNIIDQKSKFYVAKTLKQLHCTIFASKHIEELKKDKYNPKNQNHQKILLQIWKNLKPNEQLQARVSEQWISIGFQANDPATDFRGAGYLGLINLYRFSGSSKGKKSFQIASNSKTEFFYSSASLFFTMFAAELLKNRKIDYSHWVHESKQELLNRFQMVYEMLFLQFLIFWVDHCPNKTILYFNQNLKQFEKNVKL